MESIFKRGLINDTHRSENDECTWTFTIMNFNYNHHEKRNELIAIVRNRILYTCEGLSKFTDEEMKRIDQLVESDDAENLELVKQILLTK